MANRQPVKGLTTDVLVVGGGPAGLSSAIALRQRGIDCVVVEALSPTIDKACGEGLMPDALATLASLGVVIPERDGYPFRGIRFANSVHQVDAFFPHGTGIGVRRTRLHSSLAEHAHAAGAQVLWSSRLKLLGQNSALINGEEIKFRWLVGADGQASSVRRWAALDAHRKESLRYGFRRHYQISPWSDYVEVHWGPAGQVYVTPIASDCLCVVYVTRDRHSNRRDILGDFPEIARRLRCAPMLSQQKGAVSATRRLHRVANSSVALIGDASGSADAITGEGLAMTFRQAQELAYAIEAGSLESYRHAHEEISRLPHAMGALMLTMDRWPALEIRAMQALASNPAIFHELLSVHMGVKSLLGFAVRRGPQLGWNLLSNHIRAQEG
jgi:menaquinone-9 beta-reductase